MNSAFVFLKPEAVTDKMKELVSKTFKEKKVNILKGASVLKKSMRTNSSTNTTMLSLRRPLC